MLKSHLKPPDLPIFSIFRAVYLDTQGNSINFRWLYGIIMDIYKGYITKIGLIFIYWSFLRGQRGPEIGLNPIYAHFQHFRALFLATHGGISHRFRVSGISRGISKGFISEISLIFVFGSFMRRSRGQKSFN